MAIQSMGIGGSFDDHNMHIQLLEFVLEKGADIKLRDRRNVDVVEMAREMNNRYALRLIELLLAEIPVETAKWTDEKVEAICQSLRMSHDHRDDNDRKVPKSIMSSIPHEMVRRVMQLVKASRPTNMVATAMSRIKERHNGRYPIRDSDV